MTRKRTRSASRSKILSITIELKLATEEVPEIFFRKNALANSPILGIKEFTKYPTIKAAKDSKFDIFLFDFRSKYFHLTERKKWANITKKEEKKIGGHSTF